MEKSKVYFTDLRTKPGVNLLDKVEKLIKRAGIESIDFDKKFTAIFILVNRETLHILGLITQQELLRL